MTPRMRVAAAVGASVLTHALVVGAIVAGEGVGVDAPQEANAPVIRTQRIMRVALNGGSGPGSSRGAPAKGAVRRMELSARKEELARQVTNATVSATRATTAIPSVTTPAARTTAPSSTAAITQVETTTAATTTAATTTAATTTASNLDTVSTNNIGSAPVTGDGFADADVGTGTETGTRTGSERGSGQGTSPGSGTLEGATGADLDALHTRIQQSAERCYASTAARFRLKGNVTLELCVDAQGHASRVSRQGSAGSPVLDRAAEVCVVPGAEPLPVTAGCYSIPVHFRPAI